MKPYSKKKLMTSIAALAVSTLSAMAGPIQPIVELYLHNEQAPYGRGKEKLTNGSGMNNLDEWGADDWPAGQGEPSTWTATNNGWTSEYKRPKLDVATYGKMGYVIMDLGAAKDLENLYIWHARENNTRYAALFNVYAGDPTADGFVTPVNGPTNGDLIDYTFDGGPGWEKINGSELVGTWRGSEVVDMTGFNGRYVALEILDNGGGGDTGFAELAVTIVDNDPPVIASAVPADDSTGASPFAPLVATFNEDIALLGAGSITITDSTDGTDTRTIALPDAGVTVSGGVLSIALSTPLEFSTDYEVSISAGAVRDVAVGENEYAGTSSGEWTFSTIVEDTSPPVISETTPADDATEQAPGVTLVATFDENILAGAGNIVLYNVTDGAAEQTIAASDTTQVSIADNVLTISPATALPGNKEIAVQIASDAITNYSNVAFAGTNDNVTWSFNVTDTTRYTGPEGRFNRDYWNIADYWSAGVPSGTLNAIIPAGKYASGQSDAVPYSGNLTLENNAIIELGQGNNATLVNMLGGGTITLNEGSRIYMRNKPSSTHANPLVVAANSELRIGLSTSAHHTNRTWTGEISGSGLLSVYTTNNQKLFLSGDNSSWTGGFIAGDGLSANKSSTIEGDATNSLGSGPITIGDGVTLAIDAADATVGTDSTLSVSGNPSSREGGKKLKMNANDSIGILYIDGSAQPTGTYGAVDSGADYEFSWISGSGLLTVTQIPFDDSAPVLTSTSPADDATNVPNTNSLVATFDEDVYVGSGNITIKLSANDSVLETFDVTSSAGVSVSGNTVTITPSAELPGPREYYVQVDATAFVNLSGLAYAGISDTTSWSFTAADPSLPWTPAAIGAYMWLDADDTDTLTIEGSGVSVWADKSGNDRNATQTTDSRRPGTGARTIGGKNAVEFTYNSTYFQIDSFDLMGQEAWVVLHQDASDFTVLGGGGNAQTTLLSSGKMRLWKGSRPYNGDAQSSAVALQTDHTLGWLAHTDNKKYSVNGTLEVTSEVPTGAPQTVSQIGKSQYAGADGLMGELIVTNGMLSTADRQRMEGYLAHKWGTTGSLPEDHPYKSASPTFGNEDPVGPVDPPETGFAAWASGSETFAGDANGDGVADGLAFLLGAADPSADASGLLPSMANTAEGLQLSFTMLDSASRGNAALSIKHSGDLSSWTSLAIPDSDAVTDGVTFTITGTGTLSVTATIAHSHAVAGKLFGQLSADDGED